LPDSLSGRLGVDAIALLSMTAALALGEPLAGAVVALMYSGGTKNILTPALIPQFEEIAECPNKKTLINGRAVLHVPMESRPY
jgi:hypothetical protein